MMILETSGLTRRFGNLTAVDGLNLTVAEGEVFGLLGPNGAGKTTVIKMLTTLLPPTAGTAMVAGFDIRQRPAATVRFAGIPGFQSVAQRWTEPGGPGGDFAKHRAHQRTVQLHGQFQ